MTDSLLNIIIKAQDLASKSIQTVNTNIERLNERANEAANGGLKAIGGGLNALKTAAIVGAGAITAGGLALGGFATNAAMSMETMEVAMLTAFNGSSEAAKRAGEDIKNFAKRTPYETAEVMNAYIKLKNLGLEPSEKALTAYGNTASGMGKSLNDMVEAVADASTGEFERLKEFGIRASKQGANVAFTFQGVTKTVKNNSKEIEAYLQSIGNVNFAGGMEKQSKSLRGIISTLKDNFNFALIDFIESSGIYGQIKNFVTFLNSSFEVVNFEKFGEDFKNAMTPFFEFIGSFASLVVANMPFFIAFGEVIRDQVMFRLQMLSEVFTMLQPVFKVFWDYIIWALTYMSNVIFPFVMEQMAKFQAKWESDLAPAIGEAVKIMQPAIEGLVNTLKKMIEFIVPILLPVISTLIDVFLWALPHAITGFAKIFAGTAKVISFVVDGIIDSFDWLYSSATSIGGGILEFFTSLPRKIGDSFKAVANYFVDDINIHVNGLNRFIETIKDITGQGWLPSLWTLPRFEKGGVVGGSSYYGDKILARVNSGELILNQQQQQRLNSQMELSKGGNSQPTVIINMNAPTMFTDSNKKEFVKNIIYELKRQMA